MKQNNTKITSINEALVMGLVLAVTAPTEEKAKEVLQMAEGLASQMTPREVAKAKKEAEAILAFDCKWK